MLCVDFEDVEGGCAYRSAFSPAGSPRGLMHSSPRPNTQTFRETSAPPEQGDWKPDPVDLPDGMAHPGICSSFHGLWVFLLKGNGLTLNQSVAEQCGQKDIWGHWQHPQSPGSSNVLAQFLVPWWACVTPPPQPIIGPDIRNFVLSPKAYLTVHCSFWEEVRGREQGGGRRERWKMGWNGKEERKRKRMKKSFKGLIPPLPLGTN